MLYKLGYLYIVPNYGGLVLTFENDHFVFRSGSMSPLNGDLKYFNMGYYSLDYPVLYEAREERACSVLLLDSIPVRERKELVGEGFEIEIPPRDGNTPKLFYNGNCLIGGTDSKDHTTIFHNTLLFFYSIQRYSLRANYPTHPEEYLKSCIMTVKDIHSYIKSIDLRKELADLKIRVKDHSRCKIGDYDNYTADRFVECSSELIQNDAYLNSLVGLGESCIVDERVYGGAPPTVFTGEYGEEMLEKEKDRIVMQYSEDEHFGHLLYDRYNEDLRRRRFAYMWDLMLPSFKKILYQVFHLDRIEGNAQLQAMTYPLDQRGYTTVSHDTVRIVMEELNDYIIPLTIMK